MRYTKGMSVTLTVEVEDARDQRSIILRVPGGGVFRLDQASVEAAALRARGAIEETVRARLADAGAPGPGSAGAPPAVERFDTG